MISITDRAFFGHPRGLAFLAFTEVWEGFSFYGMQALLMLYMTSTLLLPEQARHVAGLAVLRATLEGMGGPLTTVAFAAQIFGLYAGLVNLLPLLGGWLGDRWLGQTRTIVLGAMLMTVGHLAMTQESLFLLALALLVSGAGCIKGNMAVQIGHLYGDDDPRRDRGFGIYMLVRNLGSLSAPLVCGTLAELWGWHYGFGVAALAMVAALLIYLAGRRHLPPEAPPSRRQREPTRLDAVQWRSTAGILLMLVPAVLIFTAAYQAYAILPVWVAGQVDRDVAGMTMPVTWLYTFDGLMTILGIVIAVRLWASMGKRDREPGELAKLAIGGALTCSAFLLLAGGALSAPGPVSLVWVLAFFVLLDLSFVWIDPPLKAFVSRYAPSSKATILMSLAITSVGVANVAVGWLGRFYERMGAPAFWLLHAAIAASGVAMLLLLRPLILRLTSGSAVAADQSPSDRRSAS